LHRATFTEEIEKSELNIRLNKLLFALIRFYSVITPYKFLLFRFKVNSPFHRPLFSIKIQE